MKLVSIAGKPWELYDMSKDREELHDLASSMADKAKSLADLWESWANRVHVYPKPGGENPKKRKLEKDENAVKGLTFCF